MKEFSIVWYIKCADNLSEYFYIFITDGVKYHNV